MYDFWWEVCCSSLFLLGKVTCIHPQLFSGFSFCPWFPAVWKWYANMHILWYFSCLVTPELPGPVVWHILLFLQCLWPLWKYLFCSVLYGSSGILNTHVGLFEILPQFLDVLFWFFFHVFFSLYFSLESFINLSSSSVICPRLSSLPKSPSKAFFLLPYFRFLPFPFDSFIEFSSLC